MFSVLFPFFFGVTRCGYLPSVVCRFLEIIWIVLHPYLSGDNLDRTTYLSGDNLDCTAFILCSLTGLPCADVSPAADTGKKVIIFATIISHRHHRVGAGRLLTPNCRQNGATNIKGARGEVQWECGR